MIVVHRPWGCDRVSNVRVEDRHRLKWRVISESKKKTISQPMMIERAQMRGRLLKWTDCRSTMNMKKIAKFKTSSFSIKWLMAQDYRRVITKQIYSTGNRPPYLRLPLYLQVCESCEHGGELKKSFVLCLATFHNWPPRASSVAMSLFLQHHPRLFVFQIQTKKKKMMFYLRWSAISAIRLG